MPQLVKAIVNYIIPYNTKFMFSQYTQEKYISVNGLLNMKLMFHYFFKL